MKNDLTYMEHGADIHSHVIAGADDGAETMNEALELLRLDRAEGIRWLYENTDADYADDVVRRNAEKYLGVEELLQEGT